MSNIGKRFSHPSVWEKPFFTRLNTEQRLFWLYLNNRCDLAGVYQLHFPVDTAYLGVSIDDQFIQDFLRITNSNSKRIELISDMRLWLVNFVRYQQVGRNKSCLSKKSGPHISIVNKLKEHGIFDMAVKSDPSLYQEYTGEVDEEPSNNSHSLDYDKANDSLNNKANTSLKLAQHKGYSSSNSSSTGDSSSSNTNEVENDKRDINPKPSLYFNNIAKQLREIIPPECIDCSEAEFVADIETYIGLIESYEKENPRAYLVAKVKNKVDWQVHTWEEFDDILLNELEGIPF